VDGPALSKVVNSAAKPCGTAPSAMRWAAAAVASCRWRPAARRSPWARRRELQAGAPATRQGL